MIKAYCEELNKWNKSINLIQKNATKNMVRRHIHDSQQICDLLNPEDPIIDIGSGAGLPGIVLTINGFQKVTLCEKNIKKLTFLRAIRQQLGLKYEIFDDIYNFQSEDHTAVSRAFGSLLKLCDIMLKINIKIGIFHKGETYMQEVKDAKNAYEFDYEIFPSTTNNKSAIVKMFNVRRKMWER